MDNEGMQSYLKHFQRVIVHLDMDAFYAQVEMKRLKISEEVPFGVVQWGMIVALNYKAKGEGVSRGMNLQQARQKCPEFQYTHVQTFKVQESEEEKKSENFTNKFYYKDDLDVNNPKIRDKYKEKVTLALYREESKKIQDIICEEAKTVEKGSIDQVFIDLTEEVLQELNNITDKSKVFYAYDWRSVFAHSDQTEREPQGVEEQLIYLAAHRTY